MPAKRKVTPKTATTALGARRPEQPIVEHNIINRIWISRDVSLNVGRKLMAAALKAKKLSLHIGIDPDALHYDEEADTGEEAAENKHDEHPLSPRFYYCGNDIKQLEHLLVNNHIMLICSATMSYGDGGFDVTNDEDAEDALEIIQDNYREPELILYF
jgi:hypothetical protein